MELVQFNFYGLILLAIFAVHTNGAQHERIALSPAVDSVAKFVNQSYIVTCNPRLDIKLVWLNSRGELVTERKGRVHVEHIQGGLSLVFESIVEADKGNWSCAWIDNKDIRSTFEMIIKRAVTFVDTPSLQIAQEHKGTLIRCKADGDPVPKISWFFNGNGVNVTSKKYNITGAGLRLRNVSLSDAGDYTCYGFQLSPSFVNSGKQLIRLLVHHKPYLRETPQTVYGFINGTTNITCGAVAEPAANFSWYRDGNRLSASASLGRDIHELPNSSVLSVLITNATCFGAYKCKVMNSIGATDRVFTLRVGAKPTPPSLTVVQTASATCIGGPADEDGGACANVAVDSDSNAIYLNLSLPTHMPLNLTEMDVTGYRVQYISHARYIESNQTWSHADLVDFDFRSDDGAGDDQQPYVLQNLTRNRIYLLRAATKNVAGFSDYSEPPLKVNLMAPGTSGGPGSPPLSMLIQLIVFITVSYT